LLTVPECHTDTQSHESNWRNQQNQHAPADGTLAFFGSTRGVAVAHRAALRESRRHPEQQHQTERGQSQLHFTTKWMMRKASGTKIHMSDRQISRENMESHFRPHSLILTSM